MIGISGVNLSRAAGLIVLVWFSVFIMYHILGRFFRLATPLRDILVPKDNSKKTSSSIPEKALDSVDDYIKEKIKDQINQSKQLRKYEAKNSEYIENSIDSIHKTIDTQKSDLIQIKTDLIKQKLDKQTSNNINLQPDSNQHLKSDYRFYSQDLLLELLFNRQDWINVSIFYYVYLGASLGILLGLSLLSNSNSFSFFNYITIFSILIAIGYGVYRYYTDDIENRQLLRNVNITRILIYLGIAIFHVYFLNTLQTIAYDSNNINSIVISLAVWCIPLLAYGAYFWYNKIRTKEQRTLLRLNRQPMAFKLTKFYVTSHLPSLKASMNGVNPLTVDRQFKSVLGEDIISLKESLEENGIFVDSGEGLLLFVMLVVEPLRNSLRDLLGDKYSKMLIQAEDSEEITSININEVWDTLNKSFLRWDSTS
jgi:hypothetical protein